MTVGDVFIGKSFIPCSYLMMWMPPIMLLGPVLHVGAHVALIKLSNAAKSWSDNDRVAAQDFQKPRNDS